MSFKKDDPEYLILMQDTPLENMAVQDTDFKHCRSRLLNKKK